MFAQSQPIIAIFAVRSADSTFSHAEFQLRPMSASGRSSRPVRPLSIREGFLSARLQPPVEAHARSLRPSRIMPLRGQLLYWKSNFAHMRLIVKAASPRQICKSRPLECASSMYAFITCVQSSITNVR